MSSDAEKAATRAALVGVWNVNAGGMTSVVELSETGQYSNTLTGGMQGHYGTWSVVDAYGAHCISFTLQNAFPTSYVGPLGTVPIQWPATETWGITGVERNRISLFGGGAMFRAVPLPEMPPAQPAPPTAPGRSAESAFNLMDQSIKDAPDPAPAAPTGPTGSPGTLKSIWHDIEHFIKKTD